MKLPHGQYQRLGPFQNKSYKKIYSEEKNFLKSQVSWKSNTNIFEKVPKKHNFFAATLFLQFNHLKVNAFQNTITFLRYLINSGSNMHVNLVHWDSLYLLFSGQTPHFLCENYKTITYNPHYRIAGSVAVILSLRVGVRHVYKGVS